jgi:hypothetical protein
MSYLTDGARGRHVLVVCVKWQNGTDRQIDRSTDEKRASQTLPLRFATVSWCKKEEEKKKKSLF